ncbi:MAG: M56 family metallopeptidase [Balneolales bacterium]
MRSAEASIQFFWRPFLIWTLISIFIVLSFRLTRISHPLFYYRALLALLLSLPFIFVFTHFISFSFFNDAQSTVATSLLVGDLVTSGSQPDSIAKTKINLVTGVAVFIALISLILAFVGLVRLLVNFFSQVSFRQTLSPALNINLVQALNDIKKKVSFHGYVELCESQNAQVPLTFGWFKPVIVLPLCQSDKENLKTVLLHEMIHVKRGDYLLKWHQEIIRAVFIINPLVSYLSREIDDYREMSCDSEVLHYNTISPKNYASLLFNTASMAKPHNPLYSSMAQNKSILMKRIIAMSKYTSSHMQNKTIQTGSLALSILLGCMVVFLSSCELQNVNNDEVQLEQSETSTESSDIFKVVEEMPEPVGGIQGIYQNLTYPEEAKRAGIEGRVSVQFTVDADGTVSDAMVLRGIGGGADQEAVDAILSTDWLPGVQEGQKVPVRFVYTVQFRLNSDA